MMAFSFLSKTLSINPDRRGGSVLVLQFCFQHFDRNWWGVEFRDRPVGLSRQSEIGSDLGLCLTYNSPDVIPPYRCQLLHPSIPVQDEAA